MKFPLALIASAALLISFSSEARAAKELKASKVAAALSKNLDLLNQWGKLPQDVQEVYAAAFNILGKQSKATFVDVARDEAFQNLCVEKDVLYLGGPMLGSVASDGARVWLRTVRPAKVEVRVKVDGVEKSFGPIASTEETDLTAVVPVTGLKPGTRNLYRVLVDGNPISVSDDEFLRIRGREPRRPTRPPRRQASTGTLSCMASTKPMPSANLPSTSCRQIRKSRFG